MLSTRTRDGSHPSSAATDEPPPTAYRVPCFPSFSFFFLLFFSFPIDEATASARYLQQKHKVPQRKIVADTWSLDTIGNAYFAAAMICEPMGYRKLLVGMALSSVYPGLFDLITELRRNRTPLEGSRRILFCFIVFFD